MSECLENHISAVEIVVVVLHACGTATAAVTRRLWKAAERQVSRVEGHVGAHSPEVVAEAALLLQGLCEHLVLAYVVVGN